MLALSPFAAYSQMSFYELPIGKTEYGIVFSPQTFFTTIGGRIDYGINTDLKISFNGGIGFADDNYFRTQGGDVTPSPIVGMSILLIKPLGQTGFEYFIQGSSGAKFTSAVDRTTNKTLVRSRELSLSVTGGIHKRIKTQSDWAIIPFFALSYTNDWETLNNMLYEYKQTDRDRNHGVTIGLEGEISPKVSIIGSFTIQALDTIFSIGLNFH